MSRRIARRYSQRSNAARAAHKPQSVTANALDGGKIRYGLLGVFDTTEGKKLQNGLTRLTLEIQQQRLKRISGSS
mgnify:CR=1 FL=1